MPTRVSLTEAEQAVVMAVSRTMAQSGEPAARIAYLMPQIVATAGFTAGVLALYRHGRLRVTASFGVAGTAAGPSLLLKHAEIAASAQDGLLAQGGHELCRVFEAEAVLALRVMGEQRCHGAMMLGGRAGHVLDPASRQYLHELTAHLAHALDNPRRKPAFTIAELNRMILHKGQVTWRELLDMLKSIV